jgi:hypothetical protein
VYAALSPKPKDVDHDVIGETSMIYTATKRAPPQDAQKERPTIHET